MKDSVKIESRSVCVISEWLADNGAENPFSAPEDISGIEKCSNNGRSVSCSGNGCVSVPRFKPAGAQRFSRVSNFGCAIREVGECVGRLFGQFCGVFGCDGGTGMTGSGFLIVGEKSGIGGKGLFTGNNF